MSEDTIENKYIRLLAEHQASLDVIVFQGKIIDRLDAKKSDQDRFWQAFCAALTGLTANSFNAQFNYERQVRCTEERDSNINEAIRYAQEALRQVGEMNKEQADGA